MEYDILPGRGSENAKKAIALAEERGLTSASVLTFRDGYKIPVVDAAETPKAKTARKRTTKKE